MSGLPLAHVGGIPIEEAVGSYGPVLLLAVGVASARLRARVKNRKRQTGR